MPRNVSIEQAYDKAAPWWQYALKRLGVPAAYEDLISRAIPKSHVGRMIDVGTGCGDLAIAACHVLGPPDNLYLVDISSNMLCQAKIRLAELGIQAECYHGDCTQVEFVPMADLVLAGHLIEHCPDPILVMKRLGEFMLPDAILLMTISKPHWCNWIIWLRWRHRWFAQKQVEDLAIKSGLRVQQVYALSSGPSRRTSLGYLLKKLETDLERVK
jgi:ubiquinone/menaquinone biosynthesis C-methylase UbiE